ncbi:MAG: beta-lactamase family protein [Clostridiales bacterium]|nr:beta-lactamase family protein [Clostridiales bacterium]
MRNTPDFSKADQVIRQALNDEAFTSACLLVGRGERVLFRRAYGRLSMEEDAPLTTEQTRYDLASLTKPLVIGMLTLRAMESGKLCLWDQLGTFVDAPEDKRAITIAQILTHTAGFSTGVHLWQTCRNPNQATEHLLAAPLRYRPGSAQQYCCAGYILLGQLLECLYDMRLSELAVQEVFWPLKMQKTGYLPVAGNIAATEMQDDGKCLSGVVHDENARFLGGVSGNAGVFSTMDDLALFVQMLAAQGALPDGSRYLSPATVRLSMQNHTSTMPQGRGLGFYLPKLDNGYTGDLFPVETIGHTGFTGTSFTLDPTSGLYVILLTNRICPSRDSMQIYRVRRLLHNAVYAAVSTAGL